MALPRLRGAVRRLTGRRLRVWHHPAFRVPVAAAEVRLGIEPRRADHVLTWLLDRHVVPRDAVEEAPEARWEAIRRVHTAEYVAALDRPEFVAPIVGLDPRLVATGPLLEMWRRSAGASADGLWWAVQHRGHAAVTAGGFHHAHPDKGAGFCGLNDVAIAIRDVRVRGFDGVIAVLDFDAHPPDGVAACLDPDDRVHIASLGVQSAWSLPDGVHDVRVPPDATDDRYLAGVDEVLRGPALDGAAAAVILAGADPLAGDRFGQLGASEEGLRERDRRVVDALGDRPALWLPAGGYTRGAWRVFANTLAEVRGVWERPDPDYDPLVRRTRRIAKALDPLTLGSQDDLLTPQDIVEALGLPTDEPRFLRHYTRQGIEYALTRYGVLDTIARLGFSNLAVEIEARSWPHMLRIFTEIDGHREVLFELSVSIRHLDGLKTLFVEWLTLRDPRVPFPPDKPRLPGQERPGLGMAKDAMVLVRETARRVGFDGITLVPAHYHVAWMVRAWFTFVDPDHEGRFRALVHHLRHLPLARASEILDGPGVPTEFGDPIRWDPQLMMFPLSEAARARIAASEPRARRVAESLSESLLPVS